MTNVAKWYEGLEQWNKAELWVRRTAERYPSSTFDWYFWFKRTGKGDVQAAQGLVEKYVENQNGQFSAHDLTALGVFYLLQNQPAKAQDDGAANRERELHRIFSASRRKRIRCCGKHGTQIGGSQIQLNAILVSFE